MKSLKNAIALAVLALTISCAPATDPVEAVTDLVCPAPSPLGMCVAIGAGDAPVFRPCDQIDFLAETCTFRVLDTTQIRALNQTMTEEACLQIR